MSARKHHATYNERKAWLLGATVESQAESLRYVGYISEKPLWGQSISANLFGDIRMSYFMVIQI
jgi:hypothetical protein